MDIIWRLRRLLFREHPVRESDEEIDPVVALVESVGPVSWQITSAAEEIIRLLSSSVLDERKKGVESLVQLIITANVSWLGRDSEEVFRNFFVSLRSWMDQRHRPFVDSLFDSAVRTVRDLERKQEYEDRLQQVAKEASSRSLDDLPILELAQLGRQSQEEAVLAVLRAAGLLTDEENEERT